ncbi:MAG: SGNH/GDSL hydrolase family protein [Clostridia bacterium]|nr:SGNH/GDSL hydrolase family protein [Clostridia bacterium]
MKINFLGDSITQGAGVACPEEIYVSVVGKLLGCEARNFGVGGTRIARQTTPSEDAIYDEDFLKRSEKMPLDADMVFVFGGSNDYGHGDAEIGELDSDNVYTFCGAVNVLIENLSKKYGKEKLCFILPLHRYNEDNPYGEGNKKKAGAPLSVYVETLVTLLTRKNVEYLDLNEYFPIPQTNTGDTYTIDGLHPNSQGHRLIAEKIAEYVRAKQN